MAVSLLVGGLWLSSCSSGGWDPITYCMFSSCKLSSWIWSSLTAELRYSEADFPELVDGTPDVSISSSLAPAMLAPRSKNRPRQHEIQWTKNNSTLAMLAPRSKNISRQHEIQQIKNSSAPIMLAPRSRVENHDTIEIIRGRESLFSTTHQGR